MLTHFIPLIYGPLGKRILSNMQPTLPFRQREVISSSYYTCLNFEKYIVYTSRKDVLV